MTATPWWRSQASAKMLVGWALTAAISIGWASQLEHSIGWDLWVYRLGGEHLFDSNLYLFDHPSPFTYPPFAALIFVPLTWVPLGVGTVIGLAVVTWCLPALWRVCLGSFVSWPIWLGVIAVSAASPAMVRETFFVQISLPLILICCADQLSGFPGRWRGVLTGLAAAIKLVPLPLLVLFAITGRRDAALRGAGAFVAASVLGFAVAPGHSVDYWTDLVWGSDRIGKVQAAPNGSVRGILARMGLEGRAADLSWLMICSALFIAAFWLGRAWWKRGELLWGVGLVGLAIAAASPIAWRHHWFWAIPVLVALWHTARHRVLAVTVFSAPFLFAEPFHRLFDDLDRPSFAWGMTTGTKVLWTVAVMVYAGWALRRPAAEAVPAPGPTTSSS